jgi:hypothetical protein
MKKLAVALFIACLCAASLYAQKTTRTYMKRNGRVVQTHRRTKANRTKADNWSTKGNINPSTRKKGTRKL